MFRPSCVVAFRLRVCEAAVQASPELVRFSTCVAPFSATKVDLNKKKGNRHCLSSQLEARGGL